MAFDNIVYIRANATNYYLSGSTTTPYNGSGTPWTAENTTPYRLSLNEGTPKWVPTPALQQTVYTGGAPFRSGSYPVSRTYPNVTESVGVQMYATSADNALFLLQQLRLILNQAMYSVPTTVTVWGGTGKGVFEVYAADVVETPSYLSEGGAGLVLIRATITWTRSPFAGNATLTTLLAAVTMTNRGTSTNPNIQALGSLTGDLVYEGQPLNLKVGRPTSVTATTRFYFASVISRVSTSVAGTQTTSATTGTGAVLGTITPDISGVLGNDIVKARFVGRVTTLTAPTKAKVAVRVSTSGGAFLVQTPWVTLKSDTGAQYVDFGMVDLSFYHIPIASAAALSADIVLLSTDGTSVTVTLDYMEFLLYFDWCQVDIASSLASNESLYVSTAHNRTTPWLPLDPPRAYAGLTASTQDPTLTATIRGTPPKARPSTSLYIAWCVGSTGQHTNTDTVPVTVTHAPLYLTVRGNT